MADSEGAAPGLTYDPAIDLARRHPDWTVLRVPLGWGISETLCLRRRVILLDASCAPAEARSCLAHAVAHLDLAHMPEVSGFFELRQEREADLLAARRLVPAATLMQVLTWTRSPAEVAAELGVDRTMLAARLSDLTPGERTVLQKAVPSIEAA